jgi:DNA primase
LEFYSQKMGAAEAYDFKSARLLLVNEKVILPKEYMVEGEDTVVQLFDEWPAYWPSTFESPHQYPQAYAYLQARRVSDKTIEKQGLRYDPAKQMIVAPYWNVYGKLAGARGRSIDPNCPKEYRHHLYKYNGKHNCTLCWYNEMALNFPGPVVVVEGQFDCWRVEEGFPKVVANLTAKPSREKLKKLGDSDLVIQIPDNDQAGEASVQTYAKACSAIGVEHRVLRLPEGLKDADECHSEWLRDKIEELL